MAFAIAMSKVVMPEQVRRFDAGSDVAALTKRLFEVSLWQPMVMMLVLSGLFMFDPRIIDTWMGPGYGLSHWVLVCTLGPHVAELVGNVSNVVLQVNGLYWWRAGCFLAAALLYIPVTLLALQYWGLVGAAACTGAGILAAYSGVAWVLLHKAGIPIFAYWRDVLAGFAPVLLLVLGIGAVLRIMLPDAGWRVHAGKVAVNSIAYLALMWCIGLTVGERLQVGAALRRRGRRQS